MAADPAVIAKIQKLLALGSSPNEHEAALAISKAQALMEQHNLEMADITSAATATEHIGRGGAVVYSHKGKPDAWRTMIVKAVAATSDLMIIERGMRVEREVKGHAKVTYEEGIAFIGFKADIELANYSVSFLLGELERLCNDYVQTRWQEIWDYADKWGMTHQEAESDWVHSLGNKHPLAARKYWLEGAAQGVAEMLRQERARRRNDNTNLNALVVRKDREVKNWWWKQEYGETYDEYLARVKAANEAYKAERQQWVDEHPTLVGTKQDPEYAPPGRRRYSRATGAAEEARWRAEQKREARRDMHAYESGLRTGRTVGVRPGVGGPGKVDGRIGA